MSEQAALDLRAGLERRDAGIRRTTRRNSDWIDAALAGLASGAKL